MSKFEQHSRIVDNIDKQTEQVHVASSICSRLVSQLRRGDARRRIVRLVGVFMMLPIAAMPLLAQAPTSGTGTVSISGSERKVTNCHGGGLVVGQTTMNSNVANPLAGCTTVYDPGTVQVTVGTYIAQANYGQGSTSLTIASALSNLLNATSSPVTATLSGATITLTSKATGSASNYSLSVSSYSDDSSDFPTPSFTATPSGATLTGGNQGVPTITWATPAPITYGTALSVTQLNASSGGLAGTYSYSPASGTFLSAGTQTLSVTFIPTDTAHYNNATSTVSLTVNKVVSTITWANPSSVTSGTILGASQLTATSSVAGKLSYTPPAGTILTYGLQTLSVTFTPTDATNYSTATASVPIYVGALLVQGPVYRYTVPASGGYTANGNVNQYQDSVMGTWNFGYDNLNRLTSALPGAGSSNNYAGYNLCMSYDAFGNRTFYNWQQGACNPSTATPTASYTSANQVVGFQYDASGNVLNDSKNAYAYDAEGRVCAMATYSMASGWVGTGYIYNADGQRVAKGTITPIFSTNPQQLLCSSNIAVTETYVLGQGGEQLTVLSPNQATTANPNGWVRTNVSAGNLMATYDTYGLHFQLTDPLGTRRVQVSDFGQPEEQCQSLPFGEGLNCNTAYRAPASADDATMLHFTGKERDTESGLDYFGARYYVSNMGRFSSPDPGWFFASRLEYPQTWNQYSYVLNNPLNAVDPDGYDCVYLNNAGNGVESVDQQSSSGECGGSGGYWVDGTATKVTLFTNSNDVGLSGQIGGNQMGQGQATDAFYTSASANQQSSNLDTVDISNTSLLSGMAYSGYVPNVRFSVDPYQTRLFGTHWCGPGGGGVPTNALDAACKAHDQCFDAAGISAANNAGGGSMTLQQAAAAQGCNAALGAAAAAHPELPGSTRVSEWLKHGDQLLVITGGRIDGNLAAGTAIR